MRVPAAAALVGLALSLALGGCGATADTTGGAAPTVSIGGGVSAPRSHAHPATTPTGTPTVAATVAPEAATAPVAVAAALHVDGQCHLDGEVLNPPSDPNRLCKWGSLILGHAYPDGSGLLGRVARAATIGEHITIDSTAYTVTSVRSAPKGTYDPATLGDALVTCDIKSGYTDGHSNNNLIVTLSPT